MYKLAFKVLTIYKTMSYIKLIKNIVITKVNLVIKLIVTTSN